MAAIALVAILLHGPRTKKTELPGQPAPEEPAPRTSPETHANASSFFSKHHREPPNQSLTNGGPAGISASAAGIITNWEDKVDEILGSASATPDKAKQMLELFARLPEVGQVEVVKHLSNLLPDQDYEPMGNLLADPQLPGDVLEALMADVLNRPGHLKLPALLEVARTPQHPKADQAKEMLGFLLEADYGDDWTQWQAKVAEWLKENPD
jgi:hypothetical protein